MILAQIRVNDVCRKFSKPFYAGGTYGLLGYIFCDLLQHDYISPYVSRPTIILYCARSDDLLHTTETVLCPLRVKSRP